MSLIPYYIIFLVTSLLAMLADIQYKFRPVYLILIVYILVMFTGFFNASNDFLLYKEIYSNSDASQYSHVEIGYLWLNKIFNSWTSEFIYFQVFFLLIVISIKLLVFKKISPYVFLAVVWYVANYVYTDSQALRHGMVLSLFLLAICLFIQKKFYLFVFVILISSTIHSISILGFFLPIGVYVLNKKKLFLPFVFLAFLIGYVGMTTFLVEFINLFSIRSFATDKLIIYTHYEEYSDDAGLMRGSIIKGFVLLLFSYYALKTKLSSRTYDVVLASYLLSLFFLAAFSDFLILSERFATYFGVVEPILISFIPLAFKREHRIYIFTGIFLLATSLLLNNSNNYFSNYNSYLMEVF